MVSSTTKEPSSASYLQVYQLTCNKTQKNHQDAKATPHNGVQVGNLKTGSYSDEKKIFEALEIAWHMITLGPGALAVSSPVIQQLGERVCIKWSNIFILIHRPLTPLLDLV